MKYALRDGEHWFQQWTAIGPASTKNPAEAATFETERQAAASPAYAFPLMFFEIVAAPDLSQS